MVDIFGNELASNVDDNTYMMDELGAKIGEVDKTLIYNSTTISDKTLIDNSTTISDKIWGSGTTISSFPLIYAGSKIWDSVTATPENHETPEERNHETEGNIHTFQDSSEDRVVSVKHDDAGRTIRKLESGKYEVFKPNGCADFYDSEGRHTGFTC